MKAKNLYYHTVFKRTNAIKMGVLGFFLAICSWPRVFIEVFTRKHFGERYYLLPLNLFLAVNLISVPFVISPNGSSFLSVVFDNITWYIYLTAFVIQSLNRYREMKREPGAYDFQKFTLSAGKINSWLYDIKLFGKTPSNRIVATYIEPGVALLAGIILITLKQPIGYLLIVCAFIYGFSWAAQYHLGDQFIMDTIDEMICNENLVDSFVHNRPPAETKGFEVYGDRPQNKEFRRKIADAMIEDEPAVDVI